MREETNLVPLAIRLRGNNTGDGYLGSQTFYGLVTGIRRANVVKSILSCTATAFWQSLPFIDDLFSNIDNGRQTTTTTGRRCNDLLVVGIVPELLIYCLRALLLCCDTREV
jgi:hypothetical protein